MLFILPTDVELTSYNEIKYKNSVDITHSLTTMYVEPKFNDVFSENNTLFDKSSNLFSSDIQISDNDFELSKLSTWEDNLDSFEIEDINLKLLIKKSINVKSKITKINYFAPKIIFD